MSTQDIHHSAETVFLKWTNFPTKLEPCRYCHELLVYLELHIYGEQLWIREVLSLILIVNLNFSSILKYFKYNVLSSLNSHGGRPGYLTS